MPSLPIIIAPHPIFKKKCEPVTEVTSEIQKIADDMLETLKQEKAFGLGANMLGITKAIAVVHLPEVDGLQDHEKQKYVFINPEIIYASEETQTFEEGSLSYPYISALITRPKHIKLKYLDYNGVTKELEAEGFFATVIQHEIDYLNGKVYLDYLSPLKREMQIKKMQKYIKASQNSSCSSDHIHDENCNH